MNATTMKDTHEIVITKRMSDITNQKFGRLLAVKISHKNKRGLNVWECLCECGNIHCVTAHDLKQGKSKSCGCLSKELAAIRCKERARHGMWNTRLYRAWHGMVSRCKYKNKPRYVNYSGRGINVCNEWANSFENFRDWAIKNGYKDELTLDRINVNGNYEPNNCRWATPREQANNTRKNIKFTINGEEKTVAEWGKAIYIKHRNIYSYRARYGDEKTIKFIEKKLKSEEGIA